MIEVIPQLFVNTLVAAAHCSLVAVGFSLIYRSGRFFHFSHAAVYTAGAYAGFVFSRWGASPWVIMAAAVCISGALGAGVERAIYRPLRSSGAGSQALLVASLGILVVAESGFTLLFGTSMKSMNWDSATRAVSLAPGMRLTFVQAWLVACAAATTVLVLAVLRYSRRGLILRAAWNDSELTRVHGADVDKAMLLAFVTGSSLAGLAGVFWAYNTALSPLMGFRALLLAAVATIVGGRKGLGGAIVGSCAVVAVQQAVLWWFPGEWEDTAVFTVLLCVLVIRSIAHPAKAATSRG